MCHISIWPKFITLKNAPTPTELNASLPLVEIHCESKFCWATYPVKHSMTEAANAATPVTQVIVRRPRQAAIQNLPHRWMTMMIFPLVCSSVQALMRDRAASEWAMKSTAVGGAW